MEGHYLIQFLELFLRQDRTAVVYYGQSSFTLTIFYYGKKIFENVVGMTIPILVGIPVKIAVHGAYPLGESSAIFLTIGTAVRKTEAPTDQSRYTTSRLIPLQQRSSIRTS
jgi:hypothetical protein